ncbi:MAG: hypothetical protein K0Q69_701 [Devosia sp.]|jgi:hypothetical protein|nr:hypothetical protein [Devosia sp.]
MRKASLARRDAIRDMVRSGMRQHDVRHILRIAPRSLSKLVRTTEPRK